MTPEEIATMQKSNEDLVAQLKLAEAGKGGDDESRKRLLYLEGEHKTLIDARDKLKEDKRIADELKLTEQGEFKILADNKQLELDELNKKLEALNTTVTGFNERDEAKFKTMLEKVPEAFRDALDDTMSLSKRIELAEKLIQEKTPGPGSKRVGQFTPDNNLTSTQRIAQGLRDKG